MVQNVENARDAVTLEKTTTKRENLGCGVAFDAETCFVLSCARDVTNFVRCLFVMIAC